MRRMMVTVCEDKAKNRISIEKFSSAVRHNAKKFLLLNFFLTYVCLSPGLSATGDRPLEGRLQKRANL